MTQLYPLIFAPVFKERVWGGRRLARWFRDLPDGPIGEAWVLSDHPQGRSPVANGPLAGETIQSLTERFGAALVGARGLHPKTGQFPLLFKLLDAQDDLSVQVHPADDSPTLPPGELGKTEMWVILDAEPGARVVYGLREGVTPEAFRSAVARGRTMDVMRELAVRPGDVLYVPAGAIHALGTGLLVAEIQQSSDTTYRVYDFDRPGLDGRPRELHVEQALAAASYGATPEPVHPPLPAPNQWQPLVTCPFFTTAQGRCEGDWAQETTPESFEALMLLEGEGQIAWEGGRERLAAGMTLLVP
ncbi:MAG: type I phosphomannose isomerase catalytic subunit, partial [Bacillota bacterium]